MTRAREVSKLITAGSFTGDVGIADKITHTGDTNTVIRFPAADTFTVESAGVERLRITSAGQVGIGTDLTGNITDSALSVEGVTAITNHDQTLMVRDKNTDDAIGRGGNIGFGAYVSGTVRTLAAIGGAKEVSGNNFNGNLVFYTRRNGQADLDERLRITSDGKIGLGTISPSAALEVTSSSIESLLSLNGASTKNVYADIDADANRRAVIRFQSAGTSQWSVGRGDSDELAASSFHISRGSSGGGNAKLVIDSAGNVGIDQTSPKTKLDVNGTIISTPVLYGSNQNQPYLIAGTVGYTGATTNWNTFGMQHRIKTDSSGVPRVTVDNYGGELFCVTNPGNFGINTNNPLRTLDVNGIALIGRPSTFWATSPDFYGINNLGSLGSQGSYAVDLTSNGYRNTSGTWTSLGINGNTGAAKIRLNPTGTIEFKTDSNKASGSSLSPTLRMRLDSGGNLALSTSANNNPVSNNVAGLALRVSGNIITNIQSVNAPHQFRRNDDGDLIRFYRNSTTDCGAVRVTSGTTHFDTSSDYRLKENMVAITDGIDRVKQLQPKRFNFIEFPKNTVDGFIAHEAQAVVPEAISGVKDGTEEQEYEVKPAVVDEEGNLTKEAVMGTHTVPKYQAIDQSKLVPLLTAALQEAIGEIETLKQRLSDAGIA